RADAHAARGTVLPVPRARRMRPAATHEDGRADVAVTRAAGALLLVDLCRRAAYRGALFRRRRSGAVRRELCGDHLVKEVLLHVGREDLVCEVELADFFSLEIEDINFRHGASCLLDPNDDQKCRATPPSGETAGARPRR